MKMKPEVEITFEIEESIAFRAPHGFRGFCGRCNALVEMMRPEAAALLTGMGERDVFRLMETGEIHFVQAERVFVCWDSLVNTTKVPR